MKPDKLLAFAYRTGMPRSIDPEALLNLRWLLQIRAPRLAIITRWMATIAAKKFGLSLA